jgi:hypothetical protein
LELFNDSKREWLLSLPAGTAMKVKHEEFNTPYKRFTIILYFDTFKNKDMIHLMLIRSNIPEWVIEKNRQNEYLPILAKDYIFLKHDSYINCSPKSPIAIDGILSQINNKTELWNLLPETIKEIIQKVNLIEETIGTEKKELIVSAFRKVLK